MKKFKSKVSKKMYNEGVDDCLEEIKSLDDNRLGEMDRRTIAKILIHVEKLKVE